VPDGTRPGAHDGQSHLSYGALTLGLELKVWCDGAPDPLAEGLVQLDGYLAGLGLARDLRLPGGPAADG